MAGKFTHINGVAQKALGTLNATTGKRDPYFSGLFAGTHRDPNDPAHPENKADRTNVLQISTNPANTRLVAVGNFTSVNGTKRSQIAQFDIGGTTYSMTPWYTTLYDVAVQVQLRDGHDRRGVLPGRFVTSWSPPPAPGVATSSATGSSGCDVVARFESSSTSSTATPTWTNYTGGDTTWTVEVTDNVVYAGGHQMWQNNPSGHQVAGPGAVAREGIAALNPVNGLPYSWNPTRARGVGVQDLLATSAGLYVGSDTTLIGKTAGNRYHARIAFLPARGRQAAPRPLAVQAAGGPLLREVRRFAACAQGSFRQRADQLDQCSERPRWGTAWVPSWSTGSSTRRTATGRSPSRPSTERRTDRQVR